MLIYDPDVVKIKDDLNVEFYPIPLNKLVTTTSSSKLGKNVVALGALGNLFDIEFDV